MSDFISHLYGTEGMGGGRLVVSMPPEIGRFLAGWMSAMSNGKHPIADTFAQHLMNSTPYEDRS
jgi:hypothetical protein